MRKTPMNLLQGQAGVYRAASKLCLMGLNPYFAAVDDGADLLVDGVRIQVKAAHLRCDKVYKNGAYWFKLGRTAIRNRRQVWEAIKFTDICDFAVFWGIEEDKLWVVPAHELDGHHCLTLGPGVSYRTIPAEELAKLKAEGKTNAEIGKIFDSSDTTVGRRLAGMYTETSRTLCQRVRNCEGRWDLLEAFIQAKGSCSAELGSPQPQIETVKEGF